MQSYKVFIENYNIEFVENEKNIKKSSIVIREKDLTKENFIHLVANNLNNVNFYVICSDALSCFTEFINQFTIIEAAGGLVYNPLLNKYLFIKRLGVWDLPKGKCEIEDNNFLDCALREVSEECGVPFSLLNVTDNLPFETAHYYRCKYTNKDIIKKTYWYFMETKVGVLKPQLEEDIELCEWFSKSKINDLVLKNTYSTIKDVLKIGFFM